LLLELSEFFLNFLLLQLLKLPPSLLLDVFVFLFRDLDLFIDGIPKSFELPIDSLELSYSFAFKTFIGLLHLGSSTPNGTNFGN
jgi:hypothetical protein